MDGAQLLHKILQPNHTSIPWNSTIMANPNIALIRLERIEIATNSTKRQKKAESSQYDHNMCNVKKHLRMISSHGAVRRAWTREPARQPQLPPVQRLSASRWATVGRPGAGRSRRPPPASAAPGPRPPPPLLGHRVVLCCCAGKGGRGDQSATTTTQSLSDPEV